MTMYSQREQDNLKSKMIEKQDELLKLVLSIKKTDNLALKEGMKTRVFELSFEIKQLHEKLHDDHEELVCTNPTCKNPVVKIRKSDAYKFKPESFKCSICFLEDIDRQEFEEKVKRGQV